MIPYGKQIIDEDDIQAVVSVLRSDWLTTGPSVELFEQKFVRFVGAKYAIAVTNGTAALHAAMHALQINSGDEVIVPAMTFAATANCVEFRGGTPVFADVCPDTLLMDPVAVERKITKRTKAIIAMDYAGQPCDYEALRKVVSRYNIYLVDDACHALGGSYKGQNVGSLADLNTFSFHPVKHITTGEGGMITTNNQILANRMRNFRNHGITSDHRQREQSGSWFYEMTELGYNYRLTDFQCALGIRQLSKLPLWVNRRRKIAGYYNDAFSDSKVIKPLAVRPEVEHAYHLYVIKLELGECGCDRSDVFRMLRKAGIGVNVHYIPVHLHPYYKNKYNISPGLCPVAESAYEKILSLPMFPQMSDEDTEEVIAAVKRATKPFV